MRFVVEPAYWQKLLNNALLSQIYGGCSSGVEFQIVDLAVAGSKPVIHPNMPRSLSDLWNFAVNNRKILR